MSTRRRARATVHSNKRQVRLEVAFLTSFVREHIQPSDGNRVTSREIYRTYTSYVAAKVSDPVAPMTQRLIATEGTFFKQLPAKLLAIEGVTKFAGKFRGYCNLKIRRTRQAAAAVEAGAAWFVAESSPERGQGLFASRDILKGQEICPYGGRRCNRSSLEAVRDQYHRDVAYAFLEVPTARVFIDPYECNNCGSLVAKPGRYCQHNVAHKANHSSQYPNCKPVWQKGKPGQIAKCWLEATQDIPKLTEIQWNYQDKKAEFYKS